MLFCLSNKRNCSLVAHNVYIPLLLTIFVVSFVDFCSCETKPNKTTKGLLVGIILSRNFQVAHADLFSGSLNQIHGKIL